MPEAPPRQVPPATFSVADVPGEHHSQAPRSYSRPCSARNPCGPLVVARLYIQPLKLNSFFRRQPSGKHSCGGRGVPRPMRRRMKQERPRDDPVVSDPTRPAHQARGETQARGAGHGCFAAASNSKLCSQELERNRRSCPCESDDPARMLTVSRKVTRSTPARIARHSLQVRHSGMKGWSSTIRFSFTAVST